MLFKKDADYERYLRLRDVGKELNSELGLAVMRWVPATGCTTEAFPGFAVLGDSHGRSW